MKTFDFINSVEESPNKNYEAYNHIKDLILNQKLFPSQKLIYRDLEEKIGMSKTPIINALIMLEKEGFVVSKKNQGFYVCGENPIEIKQILDVKQKLEELALENAIANHNSADLKMLKKHLEVYRKYEFPVYDRKRRLLDTEFHLAIAIMGKNKFLLNIIKQYYENIYFRLENVTFMSPYIEKFKKEHDRLFEAIKNRRLGEAKKILRNHFKVLNKKFFNVNKMK